jgi:hypothetical protein
MSSCLILCILLFIIAKEVRDGRYSDACVSVSQFVKKVKGKELTSPILLCTVLAEEGLSATYLSKFLTELFSAILLNLEVRDGRYSDACVSVSQFVMTMH